MGKIQLGMKAVFERKKRDEGYSQRDLARELGISYPYLSELMAGKRKWYDGLIERACQFMSVNLCDLEQVPRPLRKDTREPAELTRYIHRLRILYHRDANGGFKSVSRSIDDWLKAKRG